MKATDSMPPVNGGFGDGLPFWGCCDKPFTFSYPEGEGPEGVWCSNCRKRSFPRSGPTGLPCGNCGVLYSVHGSADHEFFDDSLQARIHRGQVGWNAAAQMYLPNAMSEKQDDA